MNRIASYKYDSISLFMWAYLIKDVLISFGDEIENILLGILMFLQIVRTFICNGHLKSKSIFGFWNHRETKFWVILQKHPYKMML